jgi:hypothetical protein
MINYNEIVNITITQVERTPQIEKFETLINQMVCKKLEEEKAIEKFNEALALGCALLITEDGHIEVVK